MTSTTKPLDLDAAHARAAMVAREHDLPVPQLMAEDGGPHDELLAFCDKTNCTLDYVIAGEWPRHRTPVDPLYATRKPQDAESKVYQIQGLAIAGLASTEPVLNLANTQLAIVATFETIARLADEVTDILAEQESAARRARMTD